MSEVYRKSIFFIHNINALSEALRIKYHCSCDLHLALIRVPNELERRF